MRRFLACPPRQAFHGTPSVEAFADGMPAAGDCTWFARVEWQKHDSWMSGGPHLDEGIPYANIIWEAAGLRDRKTRPDDVPEWARGIRSFEQLGREVGMLFFTDAEQVASSLYGAPHEVDLSSDSILDVIEDPHPRTHNAWIALVRAGDPVPFVDPPAPKPR